MKARMICIALFLMVITVGCADIYSVKRESDKDYDYSKLKTYGWMKTTLGPGFEKDDDEIIKNAVHARLKAKGFNMVSDNPDFFIAMYLHKKDQVIYQTYGAAIGVVRQTEKIEYEEGSLILDFLDAQSKLSFWKGSAKAELYKDPLSPEEQKKRVDDAVKRILVTFPPPS